ncbi:MAG: hypothetical protein M3071_11870 [Actinomycetota bacterium]|nr:hypothetical protein [Actinomycetota bacterium]
MRRGLLVGVAVVATMFFATASPAWAGVRFGVVPTFPTSATVGQTVLPASIQILNTSTPPESAGNITINSINLVPACGTTVPAGAAGDCPVAQADPGVFSVSPTGVGEAGTACAGQTFTSTVIDPARGQVTFTPNGGSVVLTPPATTNSVCRIDFTFNVLKEPTKNAGTAGVNSVQTAQIGFASGTSAVNGATGTGFGSTLTTVTKAAPTITTTATTSGKVGVAITDTATLTAAAPPAPAPTGTITFSLYQNDAACTTTAVFTSTVPVTSGGGSYTSGAFTPTSPGTYRWVASYSGDATNAAATTACGDAGETSTIAKATLTLATTASAPVTIGATISDSGVLAGGFNPTGTITFNVYGPNDATCSNTPAFTSTKLVSGNGTYGSGSFTPTAPGTYRFIASYGGDVDNAGASGTCGDANESVVVSRIAPAIVTHASGSVAAGGNVTDAATLSGGVSPTGTITFTLFGPGNAMCTGTPIFTSTKAVSSGNGNYASDPFTATAAGSFNWIAAYSGDANNAAVSTACGDANESVAVTKVTPVIITAASLSGTNISDAATLSGGAAPTGTITFNLYGPSDATCSSTPVSTSTASVSGNGSYSSSQFTPTAAGTYRFVASYNGDANNATIATACADTGESVGFSQAAKATPAIATKATASVLVGETISDSAALSGGSSPTGTVTFTLFGPGNTTCTGTPIFTSTASVNGNGIYSSQAFATTAAGTYELVAVYGGDANNAAVASACGDANESVVVSIGTGGPPPAPVVSSATQSASRWREGNALPHIPSAKPPVGTTFSFTLNVAAKITFAFTEKLPGRKVTKSHCAAPTKSNRHKPSCQRTITAGTLSFTGHTGVNKVTFQGRISRTKKLARGTYTLIITAGASSKRLTFTIVK